MVERALRVYGVMGLLENLSGIIFGRPGGEVPVDKFKDYDEAIVKVVRNECGLDKLPIITQMDFGHTDPMFVIPYGVQAEIDYDSKQFSILESGVV